MDISLLSKYRTQLMGVAILWVMFFHTPMYISDKFRFLLDIKNMGYGGVDIFMLLSGIGVFYSLNKNSSVKDFYKRRFIRIIPYYIPIVLIYSLIFYYRGDISLSTVFFNVTTISFWINQGGMFDWYIPTILFFYLISPFLVTIIKRNNKIILSLILLLFFLLFYIISGTKYAYLFGMIARFPMFLFGLYLGRQFILKKNIYCNKYYSLLLIILFIAGVVLWNYLLINTWPKYWTPYGLSLIPFWFITFPLCVFLAFVFSLFKNYKYPVLTFMGTNTLIFYIFHERIIYVMSVYEIRGIAIIAFVLTIIIGLAWKNIVDKVINFFTNKKKAL